MKELVDRATLENIIFPKLDTLRSDKGRELTYENCLEQITEDCPELTGREKFYAFRRWIDYIDTRKNLKSATNLFD